MGDIFEITESACPALGDIRRAKHGDYIYVAPSAQRRPDWSRVWLALEPALLNGARVSLLWEE